MRGRRYRGGVRGISLVRRVVPRATRGSQARCRAGSRPLSFRATLYQRPNLPEMLDSADLKVRSLQADIAGFSQIAQHILGFANWQFGSASRRPWTGFRDRGQRTIDGVVFAEMVHHGLVAPDAEQLYSMLADQAFDAAHEALRAALDRHLRVALLSEDGILSIRKEMSRGGTARTGDRSVPACNRDTPRQQQALPPALSSTGRDPIPRRRKAASSADRNSCHRAWPATPSRSRRGSRGSWPRRHARAG